VPTLRDEVMINGMRPRSYRSTTPEPEECMTCFATIGRGDPMDCKVNKDLPE